MKKIIVIVTLFVILLIAVLAMLLAKTTVVVQVVKKYETCSYTKVSGKTTEVAGNCQDIRNGEDKISNYYISFTDGTKTINCAVPRSVSWELPMHTKIKALGLSCTAIQWGEQITPEKK